MKEFIGPQTKFAVGVSGGVDSMFLSTLLRQFMQKKSYDISHITFIHLNHKVRKISDDEENFIRSFFPSSQISLVRRTSKESPTEANLRNRRYKTFKTIMQKKHINLIFLGHHFDDRVETTFLNLLR